jgi:hypothetical protein
MSDTLSIQMPVKPESAAWAREALGEFHEKLDRSSFIDLQLMVSELVADAIHAEPGDEHEIAVRVDVRDRRIHVEVEEGAIAYRLRSRRPEPGEPGWGTYLIGVLADRWGIHHQGERGYVWLEMGLAHS